MGGPGSGRRRRKTTVEACRILDIGELCDAGALRRLPRGEIVWRSERSGRTLACLAYSVAEVAPWFGEPTLVLDYLYWPTLDAPHSGGRIVLRGGEGKRYAAECTGGDCKRWVRKLYAPPGEELFLCRRCHDLTYPGTFRRALALYREVMGPVLKELLDIEREGFQAPPPSAGRAAQEATASALEFDEPDGPQELRLACLRLRKAGLSLRQIAARVGVSKSTVQRYVAAGPAGIDLSELFGERLERAFLGFDERALRQMPTVARAKRLAFYPPPAGEPEVKLLFREGGDMESAATSATLAGAARCLERLRGQAQRRLSQESRADRGLPRNEIVPGSPRKLTE